MEPLTLLAATVGCIGVCHLLSTTAERLGKGKYYSGNKQAKREDWYCFFQPADLLGTNVGDINTQPAVTEADMVEQRRRRQANRPRVQA